MTPGSTLKCSGFRVQGSGRKPRRQRFSVRGQGLKGQRTDRNPRPQGNSLNYEPSTLNQKGFTFIEIMIVLVVIGILLSLAQPSFTTSVHRAREATLKENLFIFRDVIDQYYADNGEYPTTLEAIVEGRYLRKIPKDPLTGSDSTWILVYDINEDGLEEGIFDVKSGSDLMALDGTPYNEW